MAKPLFVQAKPKQHRLALRSFEIKGIIASPAEGV